MNDESGQTTVFVIGMALVAFAVVAFTIDGTRAFLMRRTLQNAADAAAVAGASQLDQDSYYSSGGDRVLIDPQRGRAAAASWLSRRGLDVATAVDASPARVHVVLRTRLNTPFLNLIGIGSVPVAAEGTAEPLVGAPSDE